MKPSEEIRKEADQLEQRIKEEVETFVESVGVCNIRIDVDLHFVQTMDGKYKLERSGVRAGVSV